ncbi:oligosaccharide flippase family protein [Halorussus lipolyticus]|uniref:oligosaccharide flippase family protein n=1 Tax=Halorussus lipolyticus TaxID=3034024 RepID=UPI0023E7F198|nr:oligosaccharide flippase family protein [Halorussus sp. DT80]
MADTNSELSQLLSSAAVVFLGTVVGSASMLIERVLVGRALDPSAYGEISIGLAILSFGSIISMAGFAQGVPRYMPRFDAEADKRGVWLTGIGVTGLVSVVVTGVFLLNLETLDALLLDGEEGVRLLRLFVLSIPFVAGLRVTVGAIRGFEHTMYKTYVKDLLYPGGRILLLWVLLEAGIGIYAAGYAYLASAIASLVAAHLLLRRLLPLVGRFRTYAREMTAFSAPLVVSTTLMLLLTKTDTVMLGYFQPSREVGLYGAAYPLANGLLLAHAAFGFLYLPLASRLDSTDERDEIESIYTVTTKWIYLVTFPAFVAFVAFPEDVVTLFFGDRYALAAPALAVLTFGFFTNAAVGRNRETLSALGKTTPILAANLFAFICNLGLNLLLIPRYGFVGAAYASAISFITLNAVVYATLKLKFDITPLSDETLRTFVVPPAIVVPTALLLSRWTELTAVTLPVFLVSVGLLSLGLTGVVGGLQSEDGVILELVEDALGVRVPVVRRYIPDDDR